MQVRLHQNYPEITKALSIVNSQITAILSDKLNSQETVKTVENLTQEINDKDTTIANLKSDLNTRDETITKLQTEYNVLTDRISTLSTENARIIDLEQSIECLKSEIMPSSDVNKLQELVIQLNIKIRELKSELMHYIIADASQHNT